MWCHQALGQNWAMGLAIKKQHEFVQTGPYRWMRHPMYTHFWLLVIVQGIVLNNWLVLLFGLTSWSMLYFWRVDKEEKMMLQEFGFVYKNYMAITGRLLPKLFKM
jgi:protein-S-isoprenylcysteine O-methyltransferase Ste14